MPASPEWLLLGRALGVEPTPMAMSEVYVALQTGTIDGQENPLTIMYAAKFYEVTEQVVLTSHLVQPVFYAIGKPFWDKLSAAQKKSGQGGGRQRRRPEQQGPLCRRTARHLGAQAEGPEGRRRRSGGRSAPTPTRSMRHRRLPKSGTRR